MLDIDKLIKFLKVGDEIIISRILSRTKLEELNEEDYIMNINEFILKTDIYANDKCKELIYKDILSKFKSKFDVYGIEFLSFIVQNLLVNYKVVKIILTFENADYVLLLNKIIEKQIQEMYIIYDRLNYNYSLEELLKINLTERNYDFLQSIIKNYVPFAAKPGWVDISEDEKKLGNRILNFDEWICEDEEFNKDELAQDFKDLIGTNSTEVDSFIENFLDSSIEKEKIYKIDNIVVNSIRVFGPINPSNIICKYGKCKMLTCDCREENEVWFTGNCDVCKLKIRNISHCFRMPHKNGGFFGCFCSEQCIKNKFDNLEENIPSNEDIPNHNADIHKLIDMLYTINEYGILDRELL